MKNTLTATFACGVIVLLLGKDSSCSSVSSISRNDDFPLGRCLINCLNTTKTTLNAHSEDQRKARSSLWADGTKMPSSCHSLKKKKSGIEMIYLPKFDNLVEVYCDQDTKGGGWTVILRQYNPDIHLGFRKGWTDYVQGFGMPWEDHWLGLETIHQLTTREDMTLLIEMRGPSGSISYSRYDSFVVGEAKYDFPLKVSGYNGNGGDHLSPLNFRKFSTAGRGVRAKCSVTELGGWWHKDCKKKKSKLKHILDMDFTMMIRPKNFRK